MPACVLYCERCTTKKQHPLNGESFGLLLAEGVVQLKCDKCGETTPWKLVLPPRRQPAPRAPGRRLKLLLIDDDPSTLRMLQMMFRPEEYEVQTAASADEALHKLQTADFEVIVSDIRMPDFDGRSLFRFLAVYMPEYTSRVVFLTGDQTDRTMRFLKECNCPYTFKPIDFKQLQACIRQVA